MARTCTVCQHPESFIINEALVLHKQSNRGVAKQYGVDDSAVQRHRKHIPELLVKASQAMEVADADTLLDRLEALHTRTEGILDRVEQTEQYGAMLGAIRELRSNLEVIGELTKELNRTPTLNLSLSPEWLEVRAVILGAVERYPDVFGEIESAFERAENAQ